MAIVLNHWIHETEYGGSSHCISDFCMGSFQFQGSGCIDPRFLVLTISWR
jgi:hypothetical protein